RIFLDKHRKEILYPRLDKPHYSDIGLALHHRPCVCLVQISRGSVAGTPHKNVRNGPRGNCRSVLCHPPPPVSNPHANQMRGSLDRVRERPPLKFLPRRCAWHTYGREK